MDFEELFREHRADVERFVKFRLPSAADAEEDRKSTRLNSSHP